MLKYPCLDHGYNQFLSRYNASIYSKHTQNNFWQVSRSRAASAVMKFLEKHRNAVVAAAEREEESADVEPEAVHEVRLYFHEPAPVKRFIRFLARQFRHQFVIIT